MQGSKIILSPAEAALFSNAEIILTKNTIIQKTIALLGEIQEKLPPQASEFIHPNSPSPKISKGENYLGLPYVILDYPRIANNENILFVRSMFWWGNFFSSTLQFSGSYKAQFSGRIRDNYEELKQRDYSIGISQDPWVHHFEKDNYKPINDLSKDAFALILEESMHIKIAARWPLSEWDSAAMKLIESWKFLTALVA